MCAANLAFVVTGSIAAYKACDAISRLVQRGHRVRAVVTRSALEFVGATTFEGLTGERVRGDLFAAGDALEHIELGRWADAIVVCPATAHTLNRLAAGLADDFAGALLLARDPATPLVIAPAMNPAMWRHPATQASVARLREWGAQFAAPGEGRTACGEVGEGRLIEPPALVDFIEHVLERPAKALRVLITSGPTAEPIDRVRTLSNVSTGRTGAGLAHHFARAGHRVVLLRGRGSASADAAITEEIFGSVAELEHALARRLGEEAFDVVIHAAAVGDFRVESVVSDATDSAVSTDKLDSSRAYTIRLAPGPKLVDNLRARSLNPDLQVVAFKLTVGPDEAADSAEVNALRHRAAPDWIVHNDLAARASEEDFPATIFDAMGGAAAHCATRTELARQLERLVVAQSLANAAILS